MEIGACGGYHAMKGGTELVSLLLCRMQYELCRISTRIVMNNNNTEIS